MTKYGFPKRRQLKILLGVLFILVVLIGVVWIFSESKEKYSSMNLSEGWKVTVMQQTYDNISLKHLTIPEVEWPDKVTMKVILPEAPYVNAMLRVHTLNCAMCVFLEGDVIYQYGIDRMNANLLLGHGYQFVELPSQYANKELTIEFYPANKDAFSRFYPIILTNTKDSIPLFLAEHGVQIFIGGFLVIFGICFLMITIIMSGYELSFLKMSQISFISILIGLWTLANSHILQIFLLSISLTTIIEFCTLYLVPIPLMLYFFDEIKLLKELSYRILYWVLIVGVWIFDILAFTLQAMNINHLHKSLSYYHVFTVMIATYLIIYLSTQIRKKELSTRIQMIGILVVVMSIAIDLFHYLLEGYSRGAYNAYFVAILPIGVLVFVVFMLISYCIDVAQNIHNKRKQEVLIQQAYMDTLTSIPNRRYCEETMEMFEQIPEGVPYGILSIDINNLKQVNDGLGHDRGDVLITTVAKMIYNTFHEIATVGRMGGDEFIVLISDARGFQLNVHLNQLMEEMKRINEKLTDFQISISYGYATSWEVEERTVKNVYNLADSRMYQYKKRFKVDHTK